VRTLPAGPHALLLECADAAEVAAWHTTLTTAPALGLPPTAELIPAARTILIDGIPEPAALATHLSTLVPTPPSATTTTAASPLVTIPCVYDGPDLPEVAEHWGTTVDEVVARHTGTEFRVAFCGFSPGFAYLTGLGEGLAVPRRPSPRPRVPAGSVGLAGEYSGIYPSESPGGWQLIGHTSLVLFDPGREPPALLTPGTRVRFEAAAR
jgi:KipI family sensor histidine kinase inhibitor